MSKRNLATMDTDMFTPIGRLLQQAMAHGITNDMIFGGLETGQTALQALNAVSLTQNCALETRRITWDGRVYKYARVKTGCETITYHGAKATGSIALAHTILPATGDALEGATDIIVSLTGRSAGDLKGGWIMLYPKTPDDKGTMSKRISNNDATDGTTTKIYFSPAVTADAVMTHAVGYVEVFENPYAAIAWNSDTFASVVGIPETIGASLEYQWIQTWGPRVVSKGNYPTMAAHQRYVTFDSTGCLYLTQSAAECYQAPAGFVLNQGSDYSGPLVMLQISP